MYGYWQRSAVVCLCAVLCAALAACSDDGDSHHGGQSGADAGEDAITSDTGAGDAGPDDTGTDDTGGPDTGPTDTGPGDTGTGDAGPDTDTGGPSGLVLRGHLAPSGGLSLSHSFTLSGELEPGRAATESASAHFRLKLEPPAVRTSP